MSSVLEANFRVQSKIVPRYLYYFTVSTACPLIVQTAPVASSICLLEKVITMSLVFSMFSSREASPHHCMDSLSTGLWWSWEPDSRDRRTVSSMYLTRWQSGWLDLQSSVYRMNSRGDRTQPWGEPVEVTERSEKVLFTFTLCVRPVRKLIIYRVIWSSRWKRVEFLCQNVRLQGVECRWKVCEQESGCGVGGFQVFVNSVHYEQFCIINPPTCSIRELERVNKWVSGLDDVLLYDSLHRFHWEWGESHRPEVL